METSELSNTITPVVIIGAGPTGLALALGLAGQQIRSVLVEKKKETSEYSKAPGIHIRTREIFRQWGVEKEILEAGNLLEKFELHDAGKNKVLFSGDFTELEDECHKPGLLLLEQGKTEKILLNALQKTGLCDIRFNTKAIGLKADEEGVKIEVRSSKGDYNLFAEYVAGCDGADSFIRQSLNLSFKGFTYSVRAILADIEINDDRDKLAFPRFYNGKNAVTAAVRLPGGLWRIIRLQPGEPEKEEDVPKSQVAEWTAKVLGRGDFELKWASRFKIHRRSTPRFRVDRVLLAGDAAHLHSPAGGQGMNSGIQDAHNLAWKLAAALCGGKVDDLLNSYETERKAVVVENVSSYTSFITRAFLQAPLPIRKASFFVFQKSLHISAFRKRFLRRTAMINLKYTHSSLLNAKEKVAGVRLPNVIVLSAQKEVHRLYDLLPNKPVLIEYSKNGDFAENLPVKNILQIGTGAYREKQDHLYNLLNKKDGFILVRPDLHIAWARNTIDHMEEATKKALGRNN